MKADFITGTKICSTCKRTLSISMFNRQKDKPDGLCCQCKDCTRIKSLKFYYEHHAQELTKRAEYRLKHPRPKPQKQQHDKLYRERHKEELKQKAKEKRAENRNIIKDRRLRRDYGITLKELNEKFVKQNYCCSICGGELIPTNMHGYAIDHDHATGTVRGILCNNCNMALGLFRDSIAIMSQAIKYLKGDN